MVLTHREAKGLRGLQKRANREAEGCFLAEGVRALEDLLESRLPIRLVVDSSSGEDNARIQILLAEVDRRGISRRQVPPRTLAELAATETPQGVLAVAEIPVRSLNHFVAAPPGAVLLVLDAVQDPGNFGTLVRTAEALGAAGVIVLPGTVDPWNPKSVRAAAGSSFRMPIVAAEWDEVGGWLREHRFAILAAEAGGESPDDPPAGRAALVVGNEGAGISDRSREYADRIVGVPMKGRAESLNVAAAAAILLFQLLR